MILKDWLIAIEEPFWNEFKIFEDLNVAFKNSDAKNKIKISVERHNNKDNKGKNRWMVKEKKSNYSIQRETDFKDQIRKGRAEPQEPVGQRENI